MQWTESELRVNWEWTESELRVNWEWTESELRVNWEWTESILALVDVSDVDEACTSFLFVLCVYCNTKGQRSVDKVAGKLIHKHLQSNLLLPQQHSFLATVYTAKCKVKKSLYFTIEIWTHFSISIIIYTMYDSHQLNLCKQTVKKLFRVNSYQYRLLEIQIVKLWNDVTAQNRECHLHWVNYSVFVTRPADVTHRYENIKCDFSVTQFWEWQVSGYTHTRTRAHTH